MRVLRLCSQATEFAVSCCCNLVEALAHASNPGQVLEVRLLEYVLQHQIRKLRHLQSSMRFFHLHSPTGRGKRNFLRHLQIAGNGMCLVKLRSGEHTV